MYVLLVQYFIPSARVTAHNLLEMKLAFPSLLGDILSDETAEIDRSEF